METRQSPLNPKKRTVIAGPPQQHPSIRVAAVAPQRQPPPPEQTFQNLLPSLQNILLLCDEQYEIQLSQYETTVTGAGIHSGPDPNTNNIEPALKNAFIIKYRKGQKFREPELDEMYAGLKFIVSRENKKDKEPKNKNRKKINVWKQLQIVMCSERTPSSLKTKFNDLVNANGKTKYRHSDFCALSNLLNAYRSKTADRGHRSLINRHSQTLQRKFSSKQQKKLEKEKEEKAFKGLIVDSLSLIVSEEKDKKTEVQTDDNIIIDIRNTLDLVEQDVMDLNCDEFTKKDFVDLQKAILHHPKDIILEYKRLKHLEPIQLIQKLMSLSKLF